MVQEFSAFRDVPFPTQYGPNRSAVTVDVLEAGLVAAVLILVFSLLLVLPGVKGLRQVSSCQANGVKGIFPY